MKRQKFKTYQKKYEILDEYFLKHNPEPHFILPAMPSNETVFFEPLNENNYVQLYEMFDEDDHPFVISRYKNRTEWEEYVYYYVNYGRFVGKHGYFDVFARLKSTGAYFSLLNIYELSKDTFDDKHRKCFIGYTTGKKFRGMGLTLAAVRLSLQFLFETMQMLYVYAYVERSNLKSQMFLTRLGFQMVPNTFSHSHENIYYALSYEQYLGKIDT